VVKKKKKENLSFKQRKKILKKQNLWLELTRYVFFGIYLTALASALCYVRAMTVEKPWNQTSSGSKLSE